MTELSPPRDTHLVRAAVYSNGGVKLGTSINILKKKFLVR